MGFCGEKGQSGADMAARDQGKAETVPRSAMMGAWRWKKVGGFQLKKGGDLVI